MEDIEDIKAYYERVAKEGGNIDQKQGVGQI